MAWDDPPVDDGLTAEDGARAAALATAREQGIREALEAVMQASRDGYTGISRAAAAIRALLPAPSATGAGEAPKLPPCPECNEDDTLVFHGPGDVDCASCGADVSYVAAPPSQQTGPGEGERDPVAEALHNHGMGQRDGYLTALADVEREMQQYTFVAEGGTRAVSRFALDAIIARLRGQAVSR